ncbi:MAG: pyridoxal 5'-phosphate synthase [Bacteroidota bacterium]
MEIPIKLFNDWYARQLETSKAKIPSACCFTTIGLDGYPNSRFVSLKAVQDFRLIITGPINARKGREVKMIPKVSLSFWWPETERQIRIQGDAESMADSDAQFFFQQRSPDSKIVSAVFNQGEAMTDLSKLEERFRQGKMKYEDKEVEKPGGWSGFYIKPKRMEFMAFKENRLHERTVFIKSGPKWERFYLEP